MGGACGTYGGRGDVHREFCWEILKKENLEDLGVEGRMIFKWFKK